MAETIKQFIKLDNGNLTLPREYAPNEKTAKEVFGEGNYGEFDIELGFDTYCYDDTPVGGALVKSQARIDEVNGIKNDIANEDQRILDYATAKTLIDPNKTDDLLTELERRMKYGIGTEPTAQELTDYITANS